MKSSRWFGLLVLAAGCAGTDLDIGHDLSASQIAGTGGSGAGGVGGTGAVGPVSGEPLPTVPSQTGCPTDPELAALVGTWEGNVEDFYLRPVEHLRIVINGISNTQGVCGSLTWGTKEPPPAPSDPETTYPASDYWHYSGAGAGNLPPIAGFSYTLVDGGARLPNVRLGVGSNEPWHSFCALQTPVSAGDGWGCVEPNYELSLYPPDAAAICTAGGETHTAFHCLSCSGPVAELHCQCNDGGCVAAHDRDVRFELALAPDGMSMSGPFDKAGAEYHYPIIDHPEDIGSHWQTGVSIYLERVGE